MIITVLLDEVYFTWRRIQLARCPVYSIDGTRTSETTGLTLQGLPDCQRTATEMPVCAYVMGEG